MAVHAQVQFDKNGLADLCRRHGVATLSLFGSAVREDFRAGSDIDVLVEFDPGTRVSYFTLGALQQDLSDLFGQRGDPPRAPHEQARPSDARRIGALRAARGLPHPGGGTDLAA